MYYLGTASRDVKGKLYPCIGMRKNGEHIRVNFGQSPFVFDIDGMMAVSAVIHSQCPTILRLHLAREGRNQEPNRVHKVYTARHSLQDSSILTHV